MRTVIAYNERHREHYRNGHVERPGRLDAVMTHLEKDPTWRRLRRIQAEPASPGDLLLVHAEEHVRSVREACDQGRRRLDPDTYVTDASFGVALEAVGCTVAVTREVLDGKAHRGLAAVRPPGHHASSTRSMGFCLFSNAALAARWAQREAGLDRVLVVDFDVHHGNGTQEIFYEDPSVAFMSVHQSPFYPGTGRADERGEGPGVGATTNVPLPSGTGDAAYERVFRRILRPIAQSFDPELILLSAGYDAHWKDPLGGMRLTTAGFGRLVREIAEWADACCDGRLVALMEGGYDADALAFSVAATLEVMHDPDAVVRDPIGEAPGKDLNIDDYLDEVAAFFAADG
jgi:acetoin utilization deacetylase AcuC-like enzyme